MHHLETSIADPFGDAMTSVMELPRAHLHLFTLFFGYLGATQPQRIGAVRKPAGTPRAASRHEVSGINKGVHNPSIKAKIPKATHGIPAETC